MNWRRKIENHLRLNTPFVLFRMPGATTFNAWFVDDALHSESQGKEGFVFAPFAQGERLLLASDRCEKHVFDVPEVHTETFMTIEGIPREGEAAYTERVAEAIAQMKRGVFEKVVLSRTASVAIDATKYAVYFERLMVLYPDAMAYLWFHPKSGLWMGATPEVLLRYREDVLETMALAGTRAHRKGLPREWTDKERQEQQFVTDFIISGLQQSARQVTPSATYEVRAGNLWHLRTDISAKVSETALPDILATLHPTPAVCGMPKTVAMDYILAHEGYDRSYYSGYLGWWKTDGKTDLYVNLRCCKFLENRAQLFMGCGITAQSQPQAEYEETLNKSMTIRRVLHD